MIVLGTHNRKKLLEMQELFAPHAVEVRSLAEFPQALEVVEDGDSFAANARLKAIQQAQHLGHWVVGDSLDGAPGIYSARFSGEGATDERNNRLLLERLEGVPDERRGAHYVCYAVLSDPQGVVRAESSGICRGRIRREPSGTGGFGYDPLFEIPEYHLTFGDLRGALKSVLSHRARSMRRFIPQVLRAIAEPRE
jgi:XTP/dITP diphosphohydrolase